MAGFSLDRSVSIGDIGMGVSLVMVGVLAFTDLRQEVAVVATEAKKEAALVARDVQHARQANQELSEKFYLHIEHEKVDRKEMRDEIKRDMKSISDKLDRLIERELRNQ